MATEAIYTKSLGGAEDLLLDASNSPTVIQTRAGKELEITKINSSTIPYSGKFGAPSMVSIKDQLDTSFASTQEQLDTKANTVSSAYVIDTVDDFGIVPSGIDTVIVKDLNRGGTFIYDATQSAVNNGGTIFDGWVRQFDGAVNVKWFGAVGDGITDDTDSIQSALNAINNIFIPSGNYKCLGALTLPKDIKLNGTPSSIVDMAETTEDAGDLIKTHDVGLTVLPALSIAPSEFDRILTFTTPHGLSVGDIVVIWDSTNYSWSPTREYYRKGERAKVAKIDSTTQVTLENNLLDSYDTGVNMYKHSDTNSVTIRDLTIIGKPSDSIIYTLLKLTRVNDSVIENVSLKNASYTCLSIEQSFNVSVSGCNIEEDFSDVFGGDYGIVSSNSHNVYVSNSYLAAGRHSMTIGGDSDAGSCVNYNILINNCTMGTTGISAADMHENTAYSGYNNCNINGSVNFGGKHNFVTNCTIVEGNTEEGNDSPILIKCTPSMSHTVSNNFLMTNKDRDNSNGNTIVVFFINEYTLLGGVLNINNNSIELDSDVQETDYPVIGDSYINPNNIATDDKSVININGNIITNKTNTVYVGSGVYLRGASIATNTIDVINIKNNVLNNTLLNIYTSHLISTNKLAKVITVADNIFGKSQSTGMMINNCSTIRAYNNYFKDYLQVATGSSTTNSAMYFSQADYVVEYNNTTDSDSSYLNCRVGADSTVTTYYQGSKADFTGQIERNSSLSIIKM